MCVCLHYNEMGTEEIIWAVILVRTLFNYLSVYVYNTSTQHMNSDLFLITKKKKHKNFMQLSLKRTKNKTDTFALAIVDTCIINLI